uniref:C-type lectin domain-containing protein n=1 Tax=Denticeps clupeoides TaxID=299321 RepID=A0AAY4ASL1_9TELE
MIINKAGLWRVNKNIQVGAFQGLRTLGFALYSTPCRNCENYTFNCRIFQSATKDTWNMSRKYCREKGGDLVMIKSKEKQVTFLVQTVLNEMRLNGWIGLSDESEEGKWTWVDTTRAHTRFWGKRQPDNWGSVDEDCAVFHSKDDDPLSTWHDHKCSRKHLAICEKSAFQ